MTKHVKLVSITWGELEHLGKQFSWLLNLEDK